MVNGDWVSDPFECTMSKFDDSFQILGRPGLFTESMKWKSLWDDQNPSNDGDFCAPLWHVQFGEGIKTEIRDTPIFEGIGTMAGKAGKGRWLHQQGQKTTEKHRYWVNRIGILTGQDMTHGGWQSYCMIGDVP
jgi:hypothetical protein